MINVIDFVEFLECFNQEYAGPIQKEKKK